MSNPLPKIVPVPDGERLRLPSWPVYDHREIKAVQHVIESGHWWRITGTEVQNFETEFAAFQRCRYALAVTNGTQAIELALRCIRLGRGDEVVVPSFTFVSTACAVVSTGATVVFADVDKDTWCLDSSCLGDAFTKRTRVVIPVHMAGHACAMDSIMHEARASRVEVLEDCAHAHGAEYRGKRVGAFGLGGVFSFQNGKLMTAGEGGALTTNLSRIIRRARLLHNCGRAYDDERYLHTACGSNLRMNELQGAVLRVQLSRLDGQVNIRQRNAEILDAMLSEIPAVITQRRQGYATKHSHYMYMFRLAPFALRKLARRDYVNRLRASGIPAFRGFRPLHQMPAFRNLLREKTVCRTHANLTVSELLGKSAIWIHHRALLGTESDMQRIAEEIQKIMP